MGTYGSHTSHRSHSPTNCSRDGLRLFYNAAGQRKTTTAEWRSGMSQGWLDKLDNRAGHYLALLLAAAGLFFINLFTCLTLWLFWLGLPQRRRWWYAAVGAASGLAVLAKGPVGLVLPVAVTLLFLMWTRQLVVLRMRRVFLGVGAFVLVSAPWY